MDEYDIKVVRQEGEDTRHILELLRKDLKETNRFLQNILIELMSIKSNTADKSPYTGPR